MRSAFRAVPALALLALAAAACQVNDVTLGPGGGSGRLGAPRDLRASARWVLEGFSGTSAIGDPVVRLTWQPPADWQRDPFRVYGRELGRGEFTLLATITSCTSERCEYTDRDVGAGRSYEYYVATLDQNTGDETPSDYREQADVPDASRPAAPLADSASALDNAAYLRWRPAASTGGDFWKYLVYLVRVSSQSTLYQAGESDGTGYLDTRARNGTLYAYRVAAVDTFGRVSDLSAEMSALPRPDARGALLYAFSDSAAASGFRFATDETQSAVLPGTSTSAQWRFEADATGWRVVPLNGTGVLEYPGRTTDLVCGPGSDAQCRAVTQAPATGYQTTPLAVNPEFSYVFRVTGADGRTHYGVARVQILGTDGRGKALMIFDWAYQTAPDSPRLTRTGG